MISTVLIASIMATSLASALPTPNPQSQFDPNNPHPQIALGNLTQDPYINRVPCQFVDGDCLHHTIKAVYTAYFNTFAIQNTDTPTPPDQTSQSTDSPPNHRSIRRTRILERSECGTDGVVAARSDEDACGGFVADYYWIAVGAVNVSTEAKLSFESGEQAISVIIDRAANRTEDYIRSWNSVETCVDFLDDVGVLDEGLLAIGWGGQPRQYPGGEAQLVEKLTQCQLGQMLHDNAFARISNLF